MYKFILFYLRIFYCGIKCRHLLVLSLSFYSKSRRCKVRSKDLDKSINLQDQQGKSEGKVDNKEPLKNSCMSIQFEEDADQDQTNRRDIYQRHKCSGYELSKLFNQKT